MISPINVSIDQLLEITGKEVVTTVIGLVHGITTTLILFVMFLTNEDVTLQLVAVVYLGTDILFALILWYVAFGRGWLKPFHKGLFSKLSLSVSIHQLYQSHSIIICFFLHVLISEWTSSQKNV